MAGSRSRRKSKLPKIKGSSLEKIDVLDYSRGFNSYLANDAVPLDTLVKAQDARISTLGRMTTRKGANFYSNADGETEDDTQTTVTGAADQTIGTSTWKAATFTTTTAGRLTKVELNLKSNTGTAPIIVEIYTNSSGAPGTKLATSSIKNSSVTGSYAYLTARFVEAPLLANATAYWIVAYQQTEGTGNYHWSSTTAATTSLTSADSGGTWSATSYDLNFKTHLSTDGGVKGLYRAYKSDGTKKTIMAAGTTLSSISEVDGSLTSIKTGLASGATDYRFATINDTVYYVNGVDAPRKWDFSTDSAWSGSGFPGAPSLIRAHQDLLWVNDTSDPTKLVFSNEDDYETAASTNFIYVPSPKYPENIVALESLNGALHVFTTGSKHTIYGVDKATFQLVESAARKGTFSQESIAKTRNAIYFMADDGVYRFNGVEDELISAPITDKIETIMNKDSVVLGVNGNRLNIYYRSSGSAYNDKCLVYNLDYGSWESEDTNQYVARAIQWTGGTDEFEYTTGSSLVGQAYKWGEESNDYSDLGCPLSFDIRTSYLHGNEPNALKIWKRWYPRFKKQTRSFDVTVATDDEFNDSPTEYSVSVGAGGVTWGGGAEWGDGSVYGSSKFGSDRKHLSGQAYYRQYRISKSGVNVPVEFLGHTLQIQKKRLR